MVNRNPNKVQSMSSKSDPHRSSSREVRSVAPQNPNSWSETERAELDDRLAQARYLSWYVNFTPAGFTVPGAGEDKRHLVTRELSHCTCWDSKKGKARGWCKHKLAVLKAISAKRRMDGDKAESSIPQEREE